MKHRQYKDSLMIMNNISNSVIIEKTLKSIANVKCN
jgi:hypothetical protein